MIIKNQQLAASIGMAFKPLTPSVIPFHIRAYTGPVQTDLEKNEQIGKLYDFIFGKEINNE